MHLSCIVILKLQKNSRRKDSNTQPPDPKSDALSTYYIWEDNKEYEAE